METPEQCVKICSKLFEHYSTLCCAVFIVEFEQVNAAWDENIIYHHLPGDKGIYKE